VIKKGAPYFPTQVFCCYQNFPQFVPLGSSAEIRFAIQRRKKAWNKIGFSAKQGDQIGRIFACCVIVFFGAVF
jgi:hypothetical protein